MKISKEDLAEQVTAGLKFYDAASPVKETEPVVESSNPVTKKDIPHPTAPSSKQAIQSDCKQRILTLLAEAFGYNGQRVPWSTITALLEKHQLRIDSWPPGWFIWVPGQPSWPKAALPMSKVHWEEMLAWLRAGRMKFVKWREAEQAPEPGSAEYNRIAMVLTIAKMKEGASKQKVLARIKDHQIEPIHLIAEESFNASRDMAEESKTKHYGFRADSPSDIPYQQRNASDNYISLKQSHFERDDGLSDAGHVGVTKAYHVPLPYSFEGGQRHRSRTIRDDEFSDVRPAYFLASSINSTIDATKQTSCSISSWQADFSVQVYPGDQAEMQMHPSERQPENARKPAKSSRGELASLNQQFQASQPRMLPSYRTQPGQQSGQSAPQAWSSQTYYEESGRSAPRAGPSGLNRRPGPSEARPSNQPEVVRYQLPGPGSKRAKETRKLAKAANKLRNHVPENNYNDWN
ncbi:hypothetical protein C8J56DRAFT_1039058 [Mycena floridula]|nr:hypothetical protein C8J56DRAFT_1039058 [Mycena floridula]